MQHSYKLASVLCAALVAAMLVGAPAARADNILASPETRPEDRCYGLYVSAAADPAGDSATGAWVVGPFVKARCEKILSSLTEAGGPPSPIENGHVVATVKGSPSEVRTSLHQVYHCIRDDSMPLDAGPDGIRGAYLRREARRYTESDGTCGRCATCPSDLAAR